MTNLSQLKKDLELLKLNRETSNKKSGFEIIDKYRDGILTYEECMDLLKADEYVWGDVVLLILESGHYDDETKKRMGHG